MAIIRKGYLRLAAARVRNEATADREKKGEYIKSYRHLREHGNAYGILLAELILALAIAASPTWYFIGGVLALWILPAAFVWFVATWLEFGLENV